MSPMQGAQATPELRLLRLEWVTTQTCNSVISTFGSYDVECQAQWIPVRPQQVNKIQFK